MNRLKAILFAAMLAACFAWNTPAQVVTIASNDFIGASRTTINANFTNLDARVAALETGEIGAPQSPWTNDVDAAGYSLTNAGNIFATGTVNALNFAGALNGGDVTNVPVAWTNDFYTVVEQGTGTVSIVTVTNGNVRTVTVNGPGPASGGGTLTNAYLGAAVFVMATTTTGQTAWAATNLVCEGADTNYIQGTATGWVAMAEGIRVEAGTYDVSGAIYQTGSVGANTAGSFHTLIETNQMQSWYMFPATDGSGLRCVPMASMIATAQTNNSFITFRMAWGQIGNKAGGANTKLVIRRIQ